MTMAPFREPGRLRSARRNPHFRALCFCASAAAFSSCLAEEPRQDVEPLFRTIETGAPVDALEASSRLAKVYDDSMQPRLVRLLGAAPLRALQLIGDLASEGSANLLLERLPKLLDSGENDVPRMAEVACGLRKLRAATPFLLERTEDKAALRALGRIWARTLGDPPLERKDEIGRLSALAIVHRIAMGATSSLEACEAMLKAMTGEELDDFLAKHAKDRFYARRFCDEAVRKKGFDAKKGARVHEALLASPDADLVGGILVSTPFDLRPDAVRTLLKDERRTTDGRTLGELASKRLGEQ
jgi:hypothetical protein